MSSLSRNREESDVNVTTPANHGSKTLPNPQNVGSNQSCLLYHSRECGVEPIVFAIPFSGMWGRTNRVCHTIPENVGSNQSCSLYHSRECGVEPIAFAIPFPGMWGRTNRVCYTIPENVGSNQSRLPYHSRECGVDPIVFAIPFPGMGGRSIRVCYAITGSSPFQSGGGYQRSIYCTISPGLNHTPGKEIDLGVSPVLISATVQHPKSNLSHTAKLTFVCTVLLLASGVGQAEDTATPLGTALGSTTISGYVDPVTPWNPGTSTGSQGGLGDFQAIPEPSTWALIGMAGLASVAMARIRRR